MTNNLIMNIEGKQYLLHNEYQFMLFSQGDKNFINYERQKIPLSDQYNLPNMKDEYPIKIKCTTTGSLKISVLDDIEYQVILPNQNTIIRNEKEVTVTDGSEIIVSSESSNKYDNNSIINFEEQDVPEKQNTKSEIKSKFKNMYERTELVQNEDGIYSSDLDVILDIDELDGVKEIGNGTGRKAYKIIENDALDLNRSYKGKIIKIGRSNTGIEENKREFKTWSAVKSHPVLGKRFCPILERGPDHKYIIMKECNEINSNESEMATEIIKQSISVFLNLNEIEDESENGVDLKARNIGKLNGEYVMLDYPFGANFTIKS